jgi:hypothetical protein
MIWTRNSRGFVTLGVEFTQAPMNAGTVKMAILNDTCGNLIQLVEMTEAG